MQYIVQQELCIFSEQQASSIAQYSNSSYVSCWQCTKYQQPI